MLWRIAADLRRERIGMMFISIDASTGAARSAAAAAATRPDGRRLVHGREMSGGKGAKGGNLESLGNTGLADDAAKRRKPAETGGNWRALSWRGTSGVAEIAENKFYVATASSGTARVGSCRRHSGAMPRPALQGKESGHMQPDVLAVGYEQTGLGHVNAGDLVAMQLTNNTHGNVYSGFAQANETANGQPVGHLWNYGLNTWGWEDTYGGGDRDYNDLIVQLDFTSAAGHGWIA
jgi:hypothetical protein